MQGGIGRDRGVVAGVEPGGGADHKATGLQGVVAHGHRRLLAKDRPYQGARELGAVELLPLGHQGKAGQGVVVLPTGQGTDAAQATLHHLQAGAIALAPDHPFVIGGCDLAALEQ